ncbi:MAG: MBL fold metallo-hydrolase [Muribaculaceae bacterium]|nr:MBL fold metallo-hydrolase [Muribaculaceae bacterium]
MEAKVEIEFLGTGTSTGVPLIGCGCEVCASSNPHDSRLRASVVVRVNGTNLLIDCGPDFRTQMLRASSVKLDALLVTHIHYDHVAGIDDLRVYSKTEAFPVYGQREVLADMQKHMPYCFSEKPYPGSPVLKLVEVGESPFCVNGVTVVPLPVMHGKLPILGFRIGDVAYITDAKTIPSSTIDKIKGVRILVVNALRREEHPTHMNVDAALKVVDMVKPHVAYFTHMSHRIGLHDAVQKGLPEGVNLAYDGLIVRS